MAHIPGDEFDVKTCAQTSRSITFQGRFNIHRCFIITKGILIYRDICVKTLHVDILGIKSLLRFLNVKIINKSIVINYHESISLQLECEIFSPWKWAYIMVDICLQRNLLNTFTYDFIIYLVGTVILQMKFYPNNT